MRGPVAERGEAVLLHGPIQRPVACRRRWSALVPAGRPRATTSKHADATVARVNEVPLVVAVDSPATPDVVALLDQHLADMYATSPAESVHALDHSALA